MSSALQSSLRCRAGIAHTAVLAMAIWMTCARAAMPALDFNAPAKAEAPATDRAMRDLAERMLPVYQEADGSRYLANVSALQMAAGNASAAAASRRTLRERRAKNHDIDARAVLFDLFVRARELSNDTRAPFAQTVRQAFKEIAVPLDDHSAYVLAEFAAAPTAAAQSALQDALDRHRARDSIGAGDAVDLISAYVAYDAYRNLEPLLPPLLAAEGERRYESSGELTIEGAQHAPVHLVVVRPRAATHSLPALLEFTIDRERNSALECAARGFAGVVAYTRGIGPMSRGRTGVSQQSKSSLSVAPFQHDGDDARAVIEWIARQPWSDGRVAMLGGGYSGFAAWAAAKKPPRALKGIATFAADAPGINVPMNGHVFQNSSYRWSLYVANTDAARTPQFYDDERWRALDQKWYTKGSRYRDFGRVYGTHNPIFIRWLNHPSYDRFWQAMLPFRGEFARIDIPALTVTGYFAGTEPAALHYFEEHVRYRPNAEHALLIGPYDDGVMRRGVLRTLRGYSIDSAAYVDLKELRFAWFDHLLAGKPQPAEIKDRVNFQVMGANEWGHAASIDAMARRSQRYYLLPSTRSAPGALEQRKPVNTSFAPLNVKLADRRNSSWTQATDLVNGSLAAPDGLLFASPPFAADTRFSGAFSLKLDWRVSAMDVDLYAMLFEQLSSGEYVHLFNPAIEMRASYAHDPVHRRLLQAGVRQSLTVRSDRIVARQFRAGSRLVLVFGVMKRPDREVNYGTGNDVSEESIADASTLKIRLYSSSYLEMPIG